MRRYIFLFTLLLSLAAITGCVDDFGLDLEARTGINYRGELVDAYLNIKVGALSVSMDTRADEYDPYEDTEAERFVHDLWIFQYDATDKTAIANPIYMSYDIEDPDHPEYTLTSQDELENLPVKLSNNEGNPSIVYVVTNTGDASWGTDETLNTIDGLLTDALPSHEPIFVTSSTEVGDLAIPMEGNSDAFQLQENQVVTVPVSRMYAKLMIAEPVEQIYVDVATGTGTTQRVQADTEVYSVGVGNIPLYCRVSALGSLTKDKSNNETGAATYPDDVQWISRAFEASLNASSKSKIVQPDADTEGNTYYPYVVYVPENLAGQAGDAETSKLQQQAMAPSHALQLNIEITVHDPTDGAETQYPYVFYPGANTTNDYNIKRNNVYRIKTEIDALSVTRVPSANSFVGIEGHTISFFPYYRVETGGGYDFTSYLDPYGESDAQTEKGAKIDHVGIVWQTKDCIGDNRDGSLVYFTNQYGAKITSENAQNGYEQIHVHANKEGNALIAAYDTEDNILWSWHIWVRKEENGDPTHPANALVYYTYDWDNDRIYSYDYYTGRGETPVRVAGYEIMSCNLGALQDEPVYTANKFFGHHYEDDNTDISRIQYFEDGDNIPRTFGMLYQWGRKDPFPPMITTIGGTSDSNSESFNTGYYVHDYDDEHTGYHYGNDNTAVVHKTAYGPEGPSYTGSTKENDYLFYTHIHNTSSDVITGMRYSIAHPTVFICGLNVIGYTLLQVYEKSSANDSSYKDYLQNPSNYLFYGAWSEEDEDDKEWGGLEPNSTMKSLSLGIKDDAGNVITIYDDYEDDTGLGSKSIFDPCPYGWRVGSGDLWLGFTKNGINPYENPLNSSSASSMENVNCDADLSCNLGMTMYLGDTWGQGTTSWFPAQGFRLPDGCGYRVAGCGNYVNANTSTNNRINIIHIHDRSTLFKQFETQFHYTAKSTANPVRCVRDTK